MVGANESQPSSTLDVQNQRLNQLIELIRNQEAKLNRLKALRKLAKEQTAINLELTNELKTVNNSINERDGELRQALNRVDNLNRQLNNYRRTRPYRNNKSSDEQASQQTIVENGHNNIKSPTPQETSSLVTNAEENDKQISLTDSETGIGNGSRRVSFDPLALLLDAALEGELDLVIQTSKQVPDLSASHDECVTALHNAVVAGHYEVAKFLIEAGCDINVQDSDGWTPLHCAASCNNLALVKLLVENGALIYATTTSDHCTPAMKCERNEAGFEACYEHLINVQNSLGVINDGVVYALYDYEAQQDDELSFTTNEQLTVLRRDDSLELEWWWAKKQNQKEGYIPINLIGLYPRYKTFKNCDQNSNTNGNK